MQWMAMIFPAFVSVLVTEKLEKKKCTGVELIKYLGIYAFLANFGSILIFQYILKIPTSFDVSFADNLFLIHYIMVNLFFAVLLPILKLAVNPYLHLSVERRERENAKEEWIADEETES